MPPPSLPSRIVNLGKPNQGIRKGVFLDRDGVINKATVKNGLPHPPARLEEVMLLPGVEEALRKLKAAGYMLIVITNQPDVARGVVDRKTVEQINAWIGSRLPLDEFRTCYHDDRDGCHCRKPKPGAILDASREHDINLSKSFMIGDRWRDVEAGEAAGCKTIFIDCGYTEQQPPPSVAKANSLAEAVAIILGDNA